MTHDSACPDAERLAAWYDQGVTPADRARIEAHVSTCDRCQTIVATIARTDVPVAEPAREVGWWRGWRWVVPLAAGAAAVTVWAVVRPTAPPTVPPPIPASTSARAEPPPAAVPTLPPPAPDREPQRQRSLAPGRATSPPRAPVSAQPSESREEARANTNELDTAKSAPAASPVPAPSSRSATAQAAPSAAAPAGARMFRATLDAIAAPDIVSSDPAVRWRIRGATVDRSADGGATWTPQTTGASAALAAGASPAPDICWLVGRGGTVLRTTDGRSWQTVAFPERVDLVRVEATDASNATVTAVDARRFTTRDGGATWVAGGLQEF